jgi:NADH-dependent peroxiredoxin subunit F
MYDLIIIGGGPAGITAGIYAARKKLNTLIISKNFIGQTGMAGKIENWPGEKSILGPELIFKFTDHLGDYEIEKKEEEVVSISKKDKFEVKTKDNLFTASTILIATGRKPRELGIINEKDFIGKGVVYCTTCDAPLFKNKKVVVAGGGNAAFEAAIEMTSYTDNISLFDISSEFLADEILQEKARKKGIYLFNNVRIKGVDGDNFLEEIRYIDLKSNEEKTIKADGLFIQIGSLPITGFLGDFLELDDDKNIIIDFETQETSKEGVFAAGDVTNIKDKQIIISAGEGAKAALSVYRFLKGTR